MNAEFRIILLLLLMITTTWMAHTQPISTNDFFVTYAVNESTPVPKKKQVEAALSAKESRPASQDPEGNWSEQVNGFQLSIRFEKSAFILGEPIIGDVFLRNVSDFPLTRSFVSGSGFESKLCRFIMTRERGGSLEKTNQPSLFSVRQKTLYPKAQWACPARLDQIFRIEEPGTYLVTGVTGVGEPSGEIRSSTARIQIVARDSAATPDDAAAVDQSHVVTSRTNSSKVGNTAPSANNPILAHNSAQPSLGTSPFASVPSNTASSALLSSASPTTVVQPFTPAKKIGTGIIAALVALLLTILWRASRRKQGTP